jgi:hypothetical protein
MRELRVASLNILAPELLAFFWRSSYSLPLLTNIFESFTRTRLEVIAHHLRASNADVIALQETSDTIFECLGGKTTAEFIADELRFKIASSCLKDSPITYNAPPFEQDPNKSLIAFTGVTTLYNPITVEHVCHKSCATSVSVSAPEAPKFVGSPHVADEFRLLSNDLTSNKASSSQQALGIIIVNTHFRMSPYPHIANACNELFARLYGGIDSTSLSSSSSSSSLRCPLFPSCPRGTKCDLVHSTLSHEDISKRLVLIGDLNACHSIAHADLYEVIQSLQGKYGINLKDVTPFKDILKEDPSIASREASGQHTLRKECSYGDECRRKDCAYQHSFGLRLIDKRTDDRIFVSRGDVSENGENTKLAVVHSSVIHAPQLDMANKSASRDVKWGYPDTLYEISSYNEHLLKTKAIASDHPLIFVDVKQREL